MSPKEEEDIVFYNKGGRPKELTKKEAYEAKLEAKRRWRKKNKDRVSLYNEMYREAEQKKISRKKSKKRSKKSHKSKRKKSDSIHYQKKKSRSKSRKSRKSRSHSKKHKLHSGGMYNGHKVTLLKVNPDGSRIVLIQ